MALATLIPFDICCLMVAPLKVDFYVTSGKFACFMTAGFDALRDELGSSRASSVHQGLSLDVSYDEQDMVKVRKQKHRVFLCSVTVLGTNCCDL